MCVCVCVYWVGGCGSHGFRIFDKVFLYYFIFHYLCFFVRPVSDFLFLFCFVCLFIFYVLLYSSLLLDVYLNLIFLIII